MGRMRSACGEHAGRTAAGSDPRGSPGHCVDSCAFHEVPFHACPLKQATRTDGLRFSIANFTMPWRDKVWPLSLPAAGSRRHPPLPVPCLQGDAKRQGYSYSRGALAPRSFPPYHPSRARLHRHQISDAGAGADWREYPRARVISLRPPGRNDFPLTAL